jgi:hypothetical protein
MAIDMQRRYFAEPEEFFMPSNGAMTPSLSVFPQAMPQSSAFEVMPMRNAEPIMDAPQRAMVMPMTQELAPAEEPFDFSGLNLGGLDSLYGMNFGSNFGGGPMGGQYQADPNLQYIAAPLSNKGNPTSQTGGNTFAVKADQPVRLVDHRTNQVVFEGTGFDAARKATELGQGLTDQFGRKANYSIQTADPTGAYNTVAYEKKNKSTLGKIGSVVGTALPIAVSLIPGLQFLGPVASAALAGGAGAALKGDNILKGAALGGLSAAGGQVLGPALGSGGAFGTNLAPKLATAVGTGLGSTAGGLATGQSLKSSLLGGVASGALSYVAPDIQRELGISSKSGSIFRGGDTAASTGGDTGGDFGGANADIIVNAPAFSTPNIKLGGFKTPTQKYLDDAASDSAIDPATGLPYSDLITVTGSLPGAVSGGLSFGGSGGAPAVNPAVSNTDQIVVTGQRPGAITSGIDLGGLTPTEVTQKSEAERKAEEDEAKNKLGVSDYLRLAGLAAGLIGGGGGGGGGGGVPGSQAVNPIFSAKLPTPGAGGAFKVGGLDYTTPPARSAADMYRYAMGPAMDIPAGMNLSGATSPYAGYGPGTLGEETFKRVTGMAHGGAMGYARGSSRDSFAVEGPGTGRSDDIPAVLSDGEYVIDAETVALLGDGSSKAGAKKLDEMRVKVRKHKGRNLAKGKFSVNAKRPEKYLSGGRT